MFNECLEIRLNTAYCTSLTSPKIIVSSHHMKHHEVSQKYSAARRIFISLLSVSSFSGDETQKKYRKKNGTKEITRIYS